MAMVIIIRYVGRNPEVGTFLSLNRMEHGQANLEL